MSTPFRIVVGTDFSEASHPALKAAASRARAEGGSVFLAHVVDPIPFLAPGIEMMAGVDALRDGVEELAKKNLEEYRATYFDGVAVESHLLTSPSPAQAMADLAERVDADLVVVGTHGRTGMKRFVLGSVAEKIARLAPCSVLVVRE